MVNNAAFVKAIREGMAQRYSENQDLQQMAVNRAQAEGKTWLKAELHYAEQQAASAPETGLGVVRNVIV